jgi:hypothetical protein
LEHPLGVHVGQDRYVHSFEHDSTASVLACLQHIEATRSKTIWLSQRPPQQCIGRPPVRSVAAAGHTQKQLTTLMDVVRKPTGALECELCTLSYVVGQSRAVQCLRIRLPGGRYALAVACPLLGYLTDHSPSKYWSNTSSAQLWLPSARFLQRIKHVVNFHK